MKTNLYHSARHLSLLMLSALICSASIAQGFSPAVQAKLQHVIDSFQHHSDTSVIGGISAAINVDGLALWQGATGYAARNIDAQNNLLPGGTPMGTDTLSQVYSVTKTFTAALTLELANKGYFSLNDPLIKYMPLITAVNPGLNANVTIRQLLAHESGYSDYTTEINFQISVAYNPTHSWTPYETVSFAHQVDTPGAIRKYSSTNYVLLGAVMEAATGKPVEQLYREHFLSNLGLQHTYFGSRESIGNRGNLAAPHDNISGFNPIFAATGQPIFPDTITNISRFPMEGVVSAAFTAGAMVSTVMDLSQWGNALFGGRATGKATLDTMVHSIAPYPDVDGDYLGYGIFYNTQISATDSFIGHDGNALGYRALMFYQPDRKMTIAITTNASYPNPYAVAKALYAVLPGFLCGSKENRITVCFKGYSACVPRVAARLLINKGAYLGGCGGMMIANSDSLLTALLSPSELATAGIQKAVTVLNELSVSPNPITTGATITFKVAQTGNTTLRVYDMNSRQVAMLFNGMAEKGIARQLHFDAATLPAGMYIASLQTPGGTVQQKLLITR